MQKASTSVTFWRAQQPLAAARAARPAQVDGVTQEHHVVWDLAGQEHKDHRDDDAGWPCAASRVLRWIKVLGR